MAAIKFVAVMGCTPQQPIKVHTLVSRVIDGYTDNPTVFVTPIPDLHLLESERDLLGLHIAEAKGNHQKKIERDEKSVDVYNLLINKGIPYVNSIANGDQAIINLSGFRANKAPTPKGIPAKVVIKKVTDGDTNESAKIIIANMGSGLTYKVQTSVVVKGAAPSYIPAMESTSSRKLVLENLEKGKEILIRIAASNTKGMGDWSEPYSFIPR
jgi:hypothetical protein